MNLVFNYGGGRFNVAAEALTAHGLVHLPGGKTHVRLQGHASDPQVEEVKDVALDDIVFRASPASK